MSAYPRDPDATPAEQKLLDEYNACMAALRLIDAGERITGTPGAAARAKVLRRVDQIRADDRALAAEGAR